MILREEIIFNEKRENLFYVNPTLIVYDIYLFVCFLFSMCLCLSEVTCPIRLQAPVEARRGFQLFWNLSISDCEQLPDVAPQNRISVRI